MTPVIRIYFCIYLHLHEAMGSSRQSLGPRKLQELTHFHGSSPAYKCQAERDLENLINPQWGPWHLAAWLQPLLSAGPTQSGTSLPTSAKSSLWIQICGDTEVLQGR